jgi:hypothetical protein
LQLAGSTAGGPWFDHSHAIATTAAEIVTLINSRAQSPWPHEIEAIIAKVLPGNDCRWVATKRACGTVLVCDVERQRFLEISDM